MRRGFSEGFTLIEILVVVLIIGLLTTVIATNLIGRAEQAKIQLAQTHIKTLSDQLELYRLDNGRYPSDGQGLQALVRQPSGDPPARNYPPGGYVRGDSLIDPWGSQYKYRTPGQYNTHSFDLYSMGPDGQEGGDSDNADITNWDTGL
jgi:general secretion pathway protein G